MSDELTKISVPTKKINLENSETEKVEIVLKPFKQKHFAQAISIINKYFDEFNQVRENYLAKRKAILEQNLPKENIEQIIYQLDNSYNEGMEIAKAIMAKGEGVAEDIKTIVEMSISKATLVIKTESGTERSPTELDLDDLTWGECLVLLGSTVGLNMDFFAQNSQAMNLVSVLTSDPESSEPSPNPQQKTGEKSSVDLSKPTTATAK